MELLRTLTKEERKTAFREVFREAFPSSELKPLAAMERMIDQGVYEMLSLVIDDVPTGFVCNWRSGDFVLVDYLCVRNTERNNGVGARLMQRMMASYPAETVFLVETEAPGGDAAENALRRRRMGFYQRLGAQDAGYECALFGVHYNCIYWANRTVPTEELVECHAGLYRRAFNKLLYKATVQIPLHDGEKIIPMADWIDRPNED